MQTGELIHGEWVNWWVFKGIGGCESGLRGWIGCVSRYVDEWFG